MKNSNRQTCGREIDLVTYLYDEAMPDARASFERHLDECSNCREELESLARVREELSEWQIGVVPQMKIEIRRRPLEVLREFIGLFPIWVRVASTAAAAAAVLLLTFAVAGTRIDLQEGSVSFGFKAHEDMERQTNVYTAQLSRAEIEMMFAEQIAAMRAEESQRQAEMRAQLASITRQLAIADQSQAKMQVKLARIQAKQIANERSTLSEWLFASNGLYDPWGDENERDN